MKKTLSTILGLVLLSITPTIAFKPILAQPNQEKIIIAQAFPSWSRVNVNESVSVMFPGSWNYTDNSVDSVFDRTYYTVMQESLELEIPNSKGASVCDVINCKTMLALAAKEVAREGKMVLKELKPISVSLQGYPIDGIEFRADRPNESMQMIGRILIVGNKMYFLGAGTDKPYFDNNVRIFLDSFSL